LYCGIVSSAIEGAPEAVGKAFVVEPRRSERGR